MAKPQKSSNNKKLIQKLLKDNLNLRKKISGFVNEREKRKNDFLTLREELLKQCFQNKKLRGKIIEIQQGKTAELPTTIDAVT